MVTKHTEAAKKKIAAAQTGKSNSNWKHGAREDYRKKAGVKKGSGSIVHHRTGDHSDNRKSNLQVIPKSKRGEHDRKHSRADNMNKNKKSKGWNYKTKSKVKK